MDAKVFNTAGPCDPDRHYMLPPEARLGKVTRLIEQAAYFAVHAPRQCGKTTSFQALAARLTREGRYTAVWTTCENAQAAGDDATLAIPIVLQAIRSSTRHLPEALRPPADEDLEPVVPRKKPASPSKRRRSNVSSS